MNNWPYANVVPMLKWRGAMRELKLKHIGSNLLVASEPVDELRTIESKQVTAENIKVTQNIDLSQKTGKINLPCKLNFTIDTINDLSVILSNPEGEEVIIGYNKNHNHYYIDHIKSGKVDFHKEFAARNTAPRFVNVSLTNLSLIIDVSSVELFADDGLTVMTEIFFSNPPLDKIEV